MALEKSANSDEYLTNVRFQNDPNDSLYLQLLRMQFDLGTTKGSWDMILRHDSVGCMIYDKGKDSLLFVRQFRPAVFVNKVRSMPENFGLSLSDIEWNKYPVRLGKTLEFCTGIIDRPNMSSIKRVHEKIIQECGYDVDLGDIELIKTFITSARVVCAKEEIFYCEVDNEMIVEGRTADAAAKHIEKVWMPCSEVQEYVEQNQSSCTGSFLYCLDWFFDNRRVINVKKSNN